MKSKITLEFDSQQTLVILKNSEGHTFEFNPNTKFGEELFDFLTLSEKNNILTETCFVEKIILKDGYRACCGKEMTDDAAEEYCKDVWLKT